MGRILLSLLSLCLCRCHGNLVHLELPTFAILHTCVVSTEHTEVTFFDGRSYFVLARDEGLAAQA